jgi:hypothetical protein
MLLLGGPPVDQDGQNLAGPAGGSCLYHFHRLICSTFFGISAIRFLLGLRCGHGASRYLPGSMAYRAILRGLPSWLATW